MKKEKCSSDPKLLTREQVCQRLWITQNELDKLIASQAVVVSVEVNGVSRFKQSAIEVLRKNKEVSNDRHDTAAANAR